MKNKLHLLLGILPLFVLAGCQSPSARPAQDYQPQGGYTSTSYEPIGKSSRTYEPDTHKKGQAGLPERSYGTHEYDPNAGK